MTSAPTETVDEDFEIPFTHTSLTEAEALQAKPARRHLRDRLMTFAELAAIQPPEPLVEGLLYSDTLAQLTGPPGTYKSFFAMAMACCVATGRDFHDRFRTGVSGPVVYVVAEGSSSTAPRVAAWSERHGMDPNEVTRNLLILPEPIQIGDTVDITEALEVVQEVGAKLLVIDTRARCTLGLDENSNTEQGLAIDALENLRRATGCAVLVVHHAARGGSAGRGASAWDGAVWSDLRLNRPDDAPELSSLLHCAKHKDVASGCDHPLRMHPHVVRAETLPAHNVTQRSTLVCEVDDEPPTSVMTKKDQEDRKAAIAKKEAERFRQDVEYVRQWANEHGSKSVTRDRIIEASLWFVDPSSGKTQNATRWGKTRASRAIETWRDEAAK
ncbi:MAG: AAA family ATPase [Actinomycetales bacterium]|nr:AAA family ATPase [Actinomycetales bacterium]